MSAQPKPQKNPFKGLRPFKQSEENELFGRERDLILMKDRILSSRTTLLFAGSGVGKTSFLNAKVIPALKDRYCVISHNRWTGAAERKDDGSWSNRPPFRIWPPRGLGKWLKEVLWQRAWLHRRTSKADKPAVQTTAPNGDNPPPDSKEGARRKIEGAVQSVITQSLGPDNKKRLSEELAAFKKQPAGADQAKPCILILDQFEEIFQYHEYEDYFKKFISDLAAIINDDEYQVRVVFSMREEFLGELSAFDNHIPDLFNNYYRLRHPETDEAKHIIEKTCDLVKIKLHPGNLDNLVRDLSSIQQNFEIGNQPNSGESAPVRVVRRDFVPPPYLQIVCDSLWKEQFESPLTQVGASTNGSTNNGFGLFLEHYKAGSDKPVEGEESDAQRAVRVFCEGRLSPPFLKKWEQGLAARAFGFLVTKQGAKMAYELRSLAAHMDKPVWEVKHVLQKLSRPEARILRESRGPEGSFWFELYHDMYAGVVDRWKRRYRRDEKRRASIFVSTLVIAAIILPLIFFYWIKTPLDYRRTLLAYRDTLSTPDVQKDDGFTRALVAYTQLRSTFGYAGTAHSLWAEIWQRRAQLYEQRQLRDEALLCLLQAAALVKGRAEESDYLAQANNLFEGNEQYIQATFCTECRVGDVSANGKLLLTISSDNVVNLWDLTTHRYSATVCSDCDQAIFSADDRYLVTVSTVKDIANKSTSTSSSPQERSQNPTPRNGSQSGWTVNILSDSGLPLRSFEVTRPSSPRGRNDDSSPPRFVLRSVVKTDNGFLVAGIVDNKLKLWREDGVLFGDVNLGDGSNSPSGFERADFDPTGRFFAISGIRVATTLWEVTPKGLAPSKIRFNSKRRVFAFSSDGRYFLAAREDQIGLWELANQTQVLSIPGTFRSVGFGVGSTQIYVAKNGGGSYTIEVWDAEKRQRLFEPLTFKRIPLRVFLDAARKNVFISERETISKFSLESRRLVGELQTTDRVVSSALTSEGLFLGLFDSSLRLWDLPPLQKQDTFGEEADEPYVFSKLSRDGGSMLTVFDDWGNKQTSFHVWNLPTRSKVGEFSEQAVAHAMSSNPARIALIPEDDKAKIKFFGVDGKPLPDTLSFDTEIRSISFNQTNSLLAAVTNKNNQVKLIDNSNLQPLRSLQSDLNIASVEFAPNGEYLLVKGALPPTFTPSDSDPFEQARSFSDIEVWSLRNFERIPLQRDHKQPVQAAGLGGDRLFTVQNNRLEVWKLSDSRKIDAYEVGKVAVAAITPDGSLVVIADPTGILQFFDATVTVRGPWISLGSPIQKIIFASDSTSLIAITESWFHKIDVSPKKVRYSQGIFAPNATDDSLLLLSKTTPTSNTPASYLQWISWDHGWEVHEASFDGKLSKSVSKDKPDLEDWSRRLGIQIDPDGYLAPNIPRPATSSSP